MLFLHFLTATKCRIKSSETSSPPTKATKTPWFFRRNAANCDLRRSIRVPNGRRGTKIDFRYVRRRADIRTRNDCALDALLTYVFATFAAMTARMLRVSTTAISKTFLGCVMPICLSISAVIAVVWLSYRTI
jgi:hypothetical protein